MAPSTIFISCLPQRKYPELMCLAVIASVSILPFLLLFILYSPLTITSLLSRWPSGLYLKQHDNVRSYKH